MIKIVMTTEINVRRWSSSRVFVEVPAGGAFPVSCALLRRRWLKPSVGVVNADDSVWPDGKGQGALSLWRGFGSSAETPRIFQDVGANFCVTPPHRPVTIPSRTISGHCCRGGEEHDGTTKAFSHSDDR
jgi:hypothetical protein